MPVDENGVRADIIADGSSATISRMNISRVYEAYMGAFARDNRNRLISYLSGKYGPNYINSMRREDFSFVEEYLRSMYTLVNPAMIEFMDGLSPEEMEEHIYECLEEWIYLWFPPDNQYNITDVIRNIEKTQYKPHKGQLTITDTNTNRKFLMKQPTTLGRAYIMLLDRTGRDFSGVSSAKVNSFVLPIKGGEIDKYRYPHSLTPVTNLSETETRIIRSLANPVFIAELLDLALNPVSHKQLTKHMLESDRLYDPDFTIDRNINQYGNNKSLLLFKHVLRAAGAEMRYQEDSFFGDE